MTYNPNVHHRRSIRFKGYDYRQAGAYFVTIVTQGRVCCFGDINEEAILTLNRTGALVQKCWEALSTHFPYAQLDHFVVMPNHLHGILWIVQDNAEIQAGTSMPATESATPLRGTASGSLNAIIQNFKSVSTRKVNQQLRNRGGVLWQRDYYESIIWDEAHLASVQNYIANNPTQWHLDRERPFDPNEGLWI